MHGRLRHEALEQVSPPPRFLTLAVLMLICGSLLVTGEPASAAVRKKLAKEGEGAPKSMLS